MPNRSSITISVLTHVIFRYHLSLMLSKKALKNFVILQQVWHKRKEVWGRTNFIWRQIRNHWFEFQSMKLISNICLKNLSGLNWYEPSLTVRSKTVFIFAALKYNIFRILFWHNLWRYNYGWQTSRRLQPWFKSEYEYMHIEL